MSVPALRFKDNDGQDFPEWEEKRLADVGENIIGLTYSPSNVTYDESFPIVLRSSNIKNNILDLTDQVRVKEKVTEKLFTQKDDILICTRNGSQRLIGKNVLISNVEIPMTFGAFMSVFRSPFNKFIVHLFKTENYNEQIQMNLGARINQITTKNLNAFKFNFPSELEQTKIANFLTSVDEKITQLTQKCELLAQYKKSAMQQIFSQELRFRGSDDKAYPDWERRELSAWLSESKSRNFALKYNKNEVLSVSGESGVVNQIAFMGRSYAGVSVHNYHILEAGDIVYTKSPLKNSPYGIIKFNKGASGIVSTLYAVYKCNENINGELLHYYFQIDTYLNNYLKPLVRKGAKNDMKVNNAHVLTGLLTLPSSRREQDKLVEFLNKLDEKIASSQAQLAAAKQYKQGLLQQMFV